jgi:hypothetical protein
MRSATAQDAAPIESETAEMRMSATEQAAQQYLEFKRQRVTIKSHGN